MLVGIKQVIVAAQVAGVHALEPQQEGNCARCYQAILDTGLAANLLLLPWTTCSLERIENLGDTSVLEE